VIKMRFEGNEFTERINYDTPNLIYGRVGDSKSLSRYMDRSEKRGVNITKRWMVRKNNGRNW
jgi:hypothetical protein